MEGRNHGINKNRQTTSTSSADMYFTRVGFTLPETILIISQSKRSELKCFLLSVQVICSHLDPFLKLQAPACTIQSGSG